jgi:hypothetical protein
MINDRRQWVWFGLSMAILASGCYTSGGTRGKLGDAMDKASDRNTGSRKVETHPSVNPSLAPGSERDTIVAYEAVDSVLVSHDPATGRVMLVKPKPKPAPPPLLQSLGIYAGSGTMKSTTYYGMSTIGVSYEAFLSDYKRFRVDGNLRASSIPIQQTSYLSESLDGGVLLLQAGGDLNYFTTPLHTFMGHYFFFGCHYTYMGWSYKNAIYADEYDDYGNKIGAEKIESDALQGLDFSLGMGWNPVQVKWFNIGFEVSPGAILWDTSTEKGFDNDVFPILAYLSLSATLKLNLKL